MQKLVSHGHSWREIQEYSLSEIGAFFAVIVENERADHAHNLSLNWIANNADQNNLDKIVQSLSGTGATQQVSSSPESGYDWSKADNFLSGIN